MPLATRNVKRALSSKLRCEEDVKGHHIFYYFIEDGVRVTSTKVSHGSNRDIQDGIVGQMAKQMGVNRPFFAELVQCTKSRDDYVANIRAGGYLD